MLWRALTVMLLLAPAAAPGSTRPAETVRVHVYGVGGPPRKARRYSLPNVAVRVTTGTTTLVAEGRTKSNGVVVFHLNAGQYWINGYLTPPAVTPERSCEGKLARVRPNRHSTVSIYCSLR